MDPARSCGRSMARAIRSRQCCRRLENLARYMAGKKATGFRNWYGMREITLRATTRPPRHARPRGCSPRQGSATGDHPRKRCPRPGHSPPGDFRRPVGTLLEGLPLTCEPGPSRSPRWAAAGARRAWPNGTGKRGAMTDLAHGSGREWSRHPQHPAPLRGRRSGAREPGHAEVQGARCSDSGDRPSIAHPWHQAPQQPRAADVLFPTPREHGTAL